MSTATTTLQELRDQYTKLDRAAKAKYVEHERFTNEALAKYRAETNELAPAPGSELFNELKASREAYGKVRQDADNVRAQIDQLASVMDAGAYAHEDVAGTLAAEAQRTFARTVGQRIVKSERFGEMQQRIRNVGDSAASIMAALGGGDRFELGAMMSREEFAAMLAPRATTVTGGGATSAGPWIVNDFQPGAAVGYARKQPVMLGLVGVGQTDSDTVEFPRQTAVSSAAAEVAEDSAAAEATIAYETVTTSVKELAQFVPVTRRALADAAGLQSTIETDLLGGVVDRVDTQIASGNGSGQNLTGIYNASGILTFALNAYTRPDALLHLVTLLSIQAGVLGEPDAIGLYPSDWEDLRSQKDSAGNYLYGPPNIPGPKTAFGVPIVPSTVFTNGTPLGGMFRDKAQAWIREAPTVYVGYDGNDFTKRRISILAEARLAFETKRPTAFCTITGF